ncbi:MAG: hypothetical protein DMF58_00920 [Acidobacteria bacterium]|nr:MAG: hypothetical protein DMF58_00920 [Acidobacteriota bacterium]
MTAEILRATGEHIFIVLIAVGVAIIIGIPLGIWCARRARAGRVMLRIVDTIQTIPSLALFGFLIPVPLIGGIGTRTAIVALILYSLLPIVRNTLTGIRGVDPIVLDAGVAMGLTDRQLLRQVELPLAMPVIVAGIRIATVVGIGVATIAAAIGGGGLGTLIFRGVAMVDTRLMLAGALPAAALALVADVVLSAADRRLLLLGLLALAALSLHAQRRRAVAPPIYVGHVDVAVAFVLSPGNLAEAQLHVDELTQAGLRLVGGRLVADSIPAAGFRVRIGSQEAMVRSDGSFLIENFPEAAEGEVIGKEIVLQRFPVAAHLVRLGGDPIPIVVTLELSDQADLMNDWDQAMSVGEPKTESVLRAIAPEGVCPAPDSSCMQGLQRALRGWQTIPGRWLQTAISPVHRQHLPLLDSAETLLLQRRCRPGRGRPARPTLL